LGRAIERPVREDDVSLELAREMNRKGSGRRATRLPDAIPKVVAAIEEAVRSARDSVVEGAQFRGYPLGRRQHRSARLRRLAGARVELDREARAGALVAGAP